MRRFEAHWYMSTKNQKSITKSELDSLISKVKTLELQEQKDKDEDFKKDKLIYGIPDKVMSRKQTMMQRQNLK